MMSVRSSDFTYGGQKLPVGWRSRMTALPGDHGLAGDDRPVLLYIVLDAVLYLGVPAVDLQRRFAVEGLGQRRHERPDLIATCDWDGDGRYDILCNSAANTVPVSERDAGRRIYDQSLRIAAAFWLRNIGTNDAPEFDQPRRFRCKDGGIIRTKTQSFNIEPADLDGDGELALIMGDGPGFVFGLLRDELRRH
jgi:hypothetical protein